MQFLLLSSLFQVLIDGADDVHFEAPLEFIVFAVRACFDLGHSSEPKRPSNFWGFNKDSLETEQDIANFC